MQSKWDATRSMDVSHWTKFEGFRQLQSIWRRQHAGGARQPGARSGEGGHPGGEPGLARLAGEYRALLSGRMAASSMDRAWEEARVAAEEYSESEDDEDDEQPMDTDAEAAANGAGPQHPDNCYSGFLTHWDFHLSLFIYQMYEYQGCALLPLKSPKAI